MISELQNHFPTYLPNFLILLIVVIVHLLEVNIVDAPLTTWLGTDYTPVIQAIEGYRVIWFYQHWTPVLVYFFVFMYIGVYTFTLWFSPVYFFATDEQKAMKTLAYGFVILYAIAVPFYLFFPITNVYTFYHLGSSLEQVIPNVERFFYITTTHNNCFPSLHVAVTLLIARSASLTKNKRYIYFSYFCAVSVIISVMYLAIHWITDVIGGMILVGVVCLILNYVLKGEKQ